MVANNGRHFFELVGVIPDLLKKLKICTCKCWLIEPVYNIRNSITFLIPNIHCCKTVQRHIGHILLFLLNTGKLLHWCFSFI